MNGEAGGATKIAQFKRIGNGDYLTILTSTDFEAFPVVYGPNAFVRLTEWAEVNFIPRNTEQSTREQLEALSQAETELRNKFAQKLHEIENERAKLRSLTFQPVTA